MRESTTQLPQPMAFPARSRLAIRISGAWHVTQRYPLGIAGAAFLAVAMLAAVLAPWIAPADPNESFSGARLVGPGTAHLLGTDNLARDLFSRILFGLRTSLVVAVGTTALAVAGGLTLGVTSGYAGGWVDNIIQRCLDIVMAFPGLVLALTLVTMLGASIPNVIIAITIGAIPNVARVVRSSVLSTKEEDYVLAAKAMGATHLRVAGRHVLPNTLAPLIVMASILFGLAILIEASLSFLGLGVQPPTPTLGGMLSSQSRRFMLVAWWLAVFPGLAISLLVLATNIAGDSLRDALDPRLKQRR